MPHGQVENKNLWIKVELVTNKKFQNFKSKEDLMSNALIVGNSLAC